MTRQTDPTAPRHATGEQDPDNPAHLAAPTSRGTRPRRGSTSSLLGIAVQLALLVSASAQEGSSTATQDQTTTRSRKQFADHVRDAERLLNEGRLDAARAACQRALAEAILENAPETWLQANLPSLWNLGVIANKAGDTQCARRVWQSIFDLASKTLPDDHPKRLMARQSLALTESMLGNLAAALALQQPVVDVLSRTRAEEDRELLWARNTLAAIKSGLGDLPGALALQQQVLVVYERILPADRPELRMARMGLARTKRELGELNEALSIQQQVVQGLAKTCEADDPVLLDAHGEVALTLRRLGDLTGALTLQEQVARGLLRTLPPDHPYVQSAYQNLANTKAMVGDLQGALVLHMQLLDAHTRTLPDGHPDLQMARGNLAATKLALGDLPGALALEEQVYSIWSRTLPDDHPVLQTARQNLANSMLLAGDPKKAAALQQKALEVLLHHLAEDHVQVQRARSNAAITLRNLGDHRGALALQQQVVEAFARSLPDHHPDLLAARTNLALTKRLLGDLEGARELQAQVLDTYVRAQSSEHPDLPLVRGNLAMSELLLGNVDAAAHLLREAVANANVQLTRSIASARDVTQLALVATATLSKVCTLLDNVASGGATRPLDRRLEAALASDCFALLTAIRSAESRTVSLLRVAATNEPDAFSKARQALAIANRDLERALAAPLGGSAGVASTTDGRNDAILAATLARDAAELALLGRLPVGLRTTPTTTELAARLAPDEAAIVFLDYSRWSPTGEAQHTAKDRRYAAIVVTHGGAVTWRSLAPSADIQALIAGVRAEVDSSAAIPTRSNAPIDRAEPGRDPEAPTLQSDSLTPRLTELRSLLLTPVLEALPKTAKRLVVAPAEEMLLAPIEDMPLADGRSFGEAFDVQTVPSPHMLLQTPQERVVAPRGLLVGGVEFDAVRTQAGLAPVATTTPVGAAPVGGTQAADGGASTTKVSEERPELRQFAALPGTITETEQLEVLFAATFPTRPPTVLRNTDASEAAFTEQAPGKTFLHLATHGYFAPETYWKATDPRDDSPLARFDVGRNDRIAQLSPFSLTGIALAGANLPPDELGRREGILTAQEITRLDLTACYLATLSACNTTLGVRRGGTGLASLRQAFHAAGARFVLATLWEVDDVEAQKLMTDFYTRLWKNGEEPRSAMRAAKRAARERGVPFRDWAGWMITGR